jgi:hypothetical protein
MIDQIKQAVSQEASKWNKRAHNAEELINAVALSVIMLFSGYEAYTNRKETMYRILGVFAAWCVFQAFRAWGRVLDKEVK